MCGLGFYGGDIYDKENSLYGTYRDQYEWGPDDGDIDEFPHMYFGGYELDLMLSAVVLKTKLGIKGRYMRILGNPVIDDYLFTYSTYQIGPVFNTILKENEWLTISLQYYALYGIIRNGDLNSADYLRNRGVELEKSEYHTTFDGTTYSFGIGPQVIFGDTFKVYFGCSLNYTYAKFEFDKVLPVYGTDHTSYRAVSLEFNAGICL